MVYIILSQGISAMFNRIYLWGEYMKLIFNILIIILFLTAIIREKILKKKENKWLNIITIFILLIAIIGLLVINNLY